LENASLVYACTNDPDINQQIRIDARLRHILVNVADNPVSGDFISPALCRHKELTVAVSSNGLDVNKAIYWRNRIKTLLEVEE
jgi:precorrin-2 dehydrogenase/sirohydrochlorin ferrochelatase